jgi:hypothetical protein
VGIRIPIDAFLVSHRWVSERGYSEASEEYKEEEYSGEEYEVYERFRKKEKMPGKMSKYLIHKALTV